MDTLLNRYRNVTILLLVIFAQLVLLGYQVKSDRDVRMIRMWAVTAVTPLARALESVRSNTVGFVENYFVLWQIRQEYQRMRVELGRLKLENQFLKSELATAERARALSAFQARTPSRMIGARVIATGAGGASKMLFVDRGSNSGVEKGMAVVTPDGIVGKVVAAFPTASQVLLITDPGFAAGVMSQKHQVKGTLKGLGRPTCRVDYVSDEELVEVGEWIYTSGDDRIFPKGFPVGVVKVVHPGNPFKEIVVDPTGAQRGLEEVLILLEGVHQVLPEVQAAGTSIYVGPAPPADAKKAADPNLKRTGATEADRLREHYKEVGAAQGHKFGEGTPGSKTPDFNLKPESEQPGSKPAKASNQPDAQSTTAVGLSPPPLTATTTASPAAKKSAPARQAPPDPLQ